MTSPPKRSSRDKIESKITMFAERRPVQKIPSSTQRILPPHTRRSIARSQGSNLKDQRSTWPFESECHTHNPNSQGLPGPYPRRTGGTVGIRNCNLPPRPHSLGAYLSDPRWSRRSVAADCRALGGCRWGSIGHRRRWFGLRCPCRRWDRWSSGRSRRRHRCWSSRLWWGRHRIRSCCSSRRSSSRTWNAVGVSVAGEIEWRSGRGLRMGRRDYWSDALKRTFEVSSMSSKGTWTM